MFIFAPMLCRKFFNKNLYMGGWGWDANMCDLQSTRWVSGFAKRLSLWGSGVSFVN
jgi:hypothetical protein